MFNLMRLEAKKFKLERLSKGIIIANFIILGAIILLCVLTRLDEEIVFSNVNEAILLIEVLVMGTFVIYGSVILAKLTVSEYQKKTMQLMFMYPINRKKLLLGKVLIVYLFTTINVFFSSVFVVVGISIVDHFIDLVPGIINMVAVKEAIPMVGAFTIVSGFFSIVPLYFGMRKKSTGHTIVAAIIVVCIAGSNFGNTLDLKSYIYKILVLGAISVVGIILTMNKVLNNLDSVDME